jgi:hypothetical protein
MSKKDVASKKKEVDEKFDQAMESLDFFERIFKDKASK